MKKNSKSSFQEFEKFFGSPPTTNQKAWGIIHDFYNLALTYMKKKEPKEITKADLARKLGKSRSAITQIFQLKELLKSRMQLVLISNYTQMMSNLLRERLYM